jgi:hypothetical protein
MKLEESMKVKATDRASTLINICATFSNQNKHKEAL